MKFNSIIINLVLVLLCIASILFLPQGKSVHAQVSFYSTEDAVEQQFEYDKIEYDKRVDKEGEQDIKANTVIYSTEDAVEEDECKEGDDKEDKEDIKVNSVIYPNGGEIFLIGNVYTIRWNFDDSIKAVSISFSTDRGLTWDSIAEDTPNDGAFLWVVPPIPSADCLINIEGAESGEPSDMSNGVFTISPVSDRWRGEEAQ